MENWEIVENIQWETQGHTLDFASFKKEAEEMQHVKKAKASLVAAALAAAILLLVFVPVVPEKVTADRLDGGLLLTNEMKNPDVGAAPVEITQSPAFKAETQGRTYVFEGAAGSSYIFDSFGNHVVTACDSIVYREVTDVLTVYVPLGNMSYGGNLTEVETPYLDFGNMTFSHSGIPFYHCNPASIAMKDVSSHAVSSSVIFAVSGLGAAYAPGIGYLWFA